MSTITLHAASQITHYRVPSGTNLLSFLREQNCAPEAPCGGNGSCGKCRVRLQKASDAAPSEQLACRSTVTEDCQVYLDHIFSGQDHTSAIETLSAEAIPTESPASGMICAAVDLGTTTIAVTVNGPDSVFSDGAWNAQLPYGADVISRVKYIMDHPDGLQTLSALIRRQVRDLLAAAPSPPQLIIVAGNTIMQHIFAGLDPTSIAVAPFSPQTLFSEGKAWFFPEFPEKPVCFMPCISGYVGGDITAGLYAQNFLQRKKLTLFLDIGTNGEMALGNRDGILCCSVASGPAFEGAGITCGMRSIKGAIRHFSYDNTDNAANIANSYKGCLKADVIEGGAPEGLCGSGLIDLMAWLLTEEIVDETGLLPGPEDVPLRWRSCVSEDENENGIFSVTKALAQGALPSGRSREILFTAADVRQLQLAKAAVRAGIETLLKRAGHSYEDVEEVVIAGGLGVHLLPENMAAIGMLPKELVGKVTAAGNSSLSGACKAAADSSAASLPEDLQKLCAICRYLELSTDPDFADEFIDRMYFI